MPPPGQGHRVPFGAGPENGLGVASNKKHAAAGYQVLDTQGPGSALTRLLALDRSLDI